MPRKILVLTVMAVTAFIFYTQRDEIISAPSRSATSSLEAGANDLLHRAFEERLSNVQVRGAGIVERVLPDDNEGSRHQRFIIRMGTGQTILIAHNVDLAPRVEPLAKGDRVEFNGEYEWNERGGVIHWTHHDPQGRHEGGWIRRSGAVFQ